MRRTRIARKTRRGELGEEWVRDEDENGEELLLNRLWLRLRLRLRFRPMLLLSSKRNKR
jgi:hypothetical protein